MEEKSMSKFDMLLDFRSKIEPHYERLQKRKQLLPYEIQQLELFNQLLHFLHNELINEQRNSSYEEINVVGAPYA